MPDETNRQRFLRNSQEQLGIMRAAALRAEREGNNAEAEAIWDIVAAWEQITEKARAQLDRSED